MRTETDRRDLTPTCLAELRGAAALSTQPHDRRHLGTDAGAPFLDIGSHQAHGRVWLAAVCLLQTAHVPADAGALGHGAPGRRSYLPVFHFGRKFTVSGGPWRTDVKRGEGAAEGKSRGWMNGWMDGRWKRERRELGKWREKRSGDSGQNKVKS